MKTKRGFTLIELVLVIAIIIILAAVLTLNISDILNTAKRGKNSITNKQSVMTQGMYASEQKLANHNF